ncbi:S9 family peptidase [SAR92 clade bacterium H231]|nr:S9 family peptidase [SAR92 clade bacterium H231]
MLSTPVAPTIPNIDKTVERYQRAQLLLQGIWTDNIAFNETVYPIWIRSSSCFWYLRTTKTEEGGSVRFGKEYRLVDAKAATNILAFDHEALAEALAGSSLEVIDCSNLPINQVEIDLAPLVIKFTAFDKRWEFNALTGACKALESIPDNWLLSPDGQNAVFNVGYNLCLRDLNTGEERVLTSDGDKDYVYGVVGTAWGGVYDYSAQPQALWSPDSKWLFTVQRDTRQVKELPFVHHVPSDGSLRPQLEEVKLSMPGDEHIETLRLVAINIETGSVKAANYRQIPVTSNGFGFFTEGLGWWGPDSQIIYFVDVERDYKTARVVKFDPENGATHVLFEESSETQINLSQDNDESPSLLPLPDTNELIWFSERDGWAHLYLYDLTTGKLKHPVTWGPWLARYIVAYDAGRRELFVQTTGRGITDDKADFNLDRDPYYRDVARINIDTGEITTLIAGEYDYGVVSKNNGNFHMANIMGLDTCLSRGVSPDYNFVVVTRSRADEGSVSLLLDRNGDEVLLLEIADTSGLPDGWQWPEPVKLIAADNKTDIYGLMFRPSDFSPDRSYPVVSHVMNIPESTWVAKGSFGTGICLGWSYLDAASLAELGFIVVQIDARGTACRHKAFQDHSYGNYPMAGILDDHVAGIRQLAKRYSYIDLNRVGITCHTGGGLSGVQGLVQHPDFYKVGVNGCLHDPRLESASMVAEKYEGMGAPSYPPIEDQVENLRGKLLLLHGLLDWSTPPAATFRVVEALQKANKDFDMLILAKMGHAVCPNYLTRRVWDYLVKHLLGLEPPENFCLTSFAGTYEV